MRKEIKCFTNFMKESYYTIGQVAKLFKIKTDTIRYYEEIDLVKCKLRGVQNHYRKYSNSEIKILKFIFLSKSLGFSLKEIKELLEISTHKINCPETQKRINKKINKIDYTISTLKLYKQKLLKQLFQCEIHNSLSCPLYQNNFNIDDLIEKHEN